MKRIHHKKRETSSWIYSFFIILLLSIPIFLSMLPEFLNLYDTMIGKKGLKCIIKSIIIKDSSSLLFMILISIPSLIIIRLVCMDKTRIKRTIIFILSTIVTFAFVFAIGENFNHTRFYENENINDYESTGNIRLLKLCISDYFSDEYDEYIVSHSVYDHYSHISSTGSRGSGSSNHYEYVVCFSDNSEHIFSNPVVQAQIGRNDYKYYSENLPNGYDIKITVYKKSRFIRSIEPSVSFTKQESYSKLYELTLNKDSLTYKANTSDHPLKNLQWCGFKKGESEEITNSMFGIGAENSTVFDRGYCNADEICLYAVFDGKYRRVSNIISLSDIIKNNQQ